MVKYFRISISITLLSLILKLKANSSLPGFHAPWGSNHPFSVWVITVLTSTVGFATMGKPMYSVMQIPSYSKSFIYPCYVLNTNLLMSIDLPPLTPAVHDSGLYTFCPDICIFTLAASIKELMVSIF